MMRAAAIGFRAHSGWAVAVVVGGSIGAPEVLRRARIEMVNGRSPGGKQPYHAATEMEFGAAEKLINGAIDSANRMASTALVELSAELRAGNVKVATGLILTGSGRELADLKSILSSHPAIHTAEGEMFRAALSYACRSCGLQATRICEREIMGVAANRLKLTERQLAARLIEMGRSVGRPWTADEKLATLAAWLGL
jgi:hypothetical protein